MIKTEKTFDNRVAELRSQGTSLRAANKIALSEERERNERTAEQTYRKDS